MQQILIVEDDDGKICNPDYYPAIGESLSLTYCDIEYIDSRTGKLADEDTPFAYYEEKKINQRFLAGRLGNPLLTYLERVGGMLIQFVKVLKAFLPFLY